MSMFSASGRSRRNLRPKVVHSISDSEAEDQDLNTDNPGITNVVNRVKMVVITYNSLFLR